jgi:hypothetical protein
MHFVETDCELNSVDFTDSRKIRAIADIGFKTMGSKQR